MKLSFNLKNLYETRLGYIFIFYQIFLLINGITRTILFIKEYDLINNWFFNFLFINLTGIYFDTLTFFYFTLPSVVLLLVFPTRWEQTRLAKILFIAVLFIMTALLVFQGIAECFFWEEFTSRFNFIAVDYLIYTKELIGNIQESYPMHWVYLSIALLTITTLLLFKKSILKIYQFQSPQRITKRLKLLIPFLLIPLLSFFIFGNYFRNLSNNLIVDQLGKNGLYEFGSAFWHNKLDYYAFYKTISDDAVLNQIKLELNEPSTQISQNANNVIIKKINTISPPNNFNLVMIVVESLGAKYLGSFGNPENLTPHLDKLQNESLFFTNLYATGTRTIRGLEALTLSLPPTPGFSVVKRPNNENLFSLGAILKHQGYQNQFIYGGYGYFDNMNYYFSNNGFAILDRTSFDGSEIKFANVWGICDGDVYDRALKEIDISSTQNKPFFKFILTTSNHRPFTYPEGLIDLPPFVSGRSGAIKYTDYAIWDFLTKAKSKSWFKNTIFVIVADHGTGGRGTTSIAVADYHIPMIVYAPGIITPQKISTIASQIDVAPTILALLNISYESRFMGKNILTMGKEDERFVLGTYQTLGLFQNNKVVSLEPKRRFSVQEYDPITKIFGNLVQDDALVNKSITYYQYASYLLNNRFFQWEP